MNTVLQDVVSIVSGGSLYCLITLGLALLVGLLGLMNFAYGELVMVGGFTLFLLRDSPWPVQIAAVLAATVIVSLLTERLAFRPLRNATPVTLLIASFSVSIILQNLARMTVSADRGCVWLPRERQVDTRQRYAWRVWAAAAAVAALVLLTSPRWPSWHADPSRRQAADALPSVPRGTAVSPYAAPVASFPVSGGVLSQTRLGPLPAPVSTARQRDVRAADDSHQEWGIPVMPPLPVLTMPTVDVVPLELEQIAVVPVSVPSLFVEELSHPVDSRERK